MADQKISQLSDGGASQATDEYVVARSGANYRIDGASVAAAATSVGTLTSLSISGQISSTAGAVISGSGASTSARYVVLSTTGGDFYTGIESSAGGSLLSGSSAYARIFGTSAAYPLEFFTNNVKRASIDSSGNLAVDTNTLYVDAANNYVGIGTATPGFKLDVVGTGAGSLARINNTTTGKAIMAFANNGTTAGLLGLSGGWEGDSTSDMSLIAETGYGLRFYTNGSATERMVIDTSGNLGIGVTPSAGVRLHIVDSGGPTVRLVRTSNRFDFSADNDYAELNARDTSTYLRFKTADTERVRITSGGTFCVAKTSDDDTIVGMNFRDTGYGTFTRSSSSNSDSTVHVYSTGAGAYRFYVGMGGTVYATNTTISAISDARLKENIRDLDVGLDAILALKPRKYDWKEGKGQDTKDVRGFIAQEFEEVFPDLVDEWKDEAPEGEEPYRSVRQDLIPVLVKAMQEQQAMIVALEARLEALEA